MSLEHCEICDELTDRAGRLDDSLICAECGKIICEECVQKGFDNVIVCEECFNKVLKKYRYQDSFNIMKFMEDVNQ